MARRVVLARIALGEGDRRVMSADGTAVALDVRCNGVSPIGAGTRRCREGQG